jgi:hypothetical protein
VIATVPEEVKQALAVLFDAVDPRAERSEIE